MKAETVLAMLKTYYNVKVSLSESSNNKIVIYAPAGALHPEAERILSKYKLLISRYIQNQKRTLRKQKKAKCPQDPNKEFHKLLIYTLREVEPYRFTDAPLTWSKRHKCSSIVYEIFKAETNLDAAILDKHLEEAKYWSNRLIAAYKELFAVYRGISKRTKPEKNRI